MAKKTSKPGDKVVKAPPVKSVPGAEIVLPLENRLPHRAFDYLTDLDPLPKSVHPAFDYDA